LLGQPMYHCGSRDLDDDRTRTEERGEGSLSDAPRGEGWWIAWDGRWYPPHLHPDATQPDGTASESPLEWWLASDGRWYAPGARPDSRAISDSENADTAGGDTRGPDGGPAALSGPGGSGPLGGGVPAGVGAARDRSQITEGSWSKMRLPTLAPAPAAHPTGRRRDEFVLRQPGHILWWPRSSQAARRLLVLVILFALAAGLAVTLVNVL
jgi:hypothetical protein